MIQLLAILMLAGGLDHTLTIEERQEGFAGVTGTIWKIKADGRWSSMDFVNEHWSNRRTGRLTAAEVKELASAVADLEDTVIGTPPEINTKTISIRYGDRKTTCLLDAGQSLEDAAEKDEALREFQRIHKAVMKAINKEE